MAIKQETIDQKAAIVEEIRQKLEKAKSVVVYDYRGLTVEQVTALRTQFRSVGVEYRVLKNKAVKRAADLLGIEGLETHLAGPSAFIFGYDDPVVPAKILTEYVKKIKATEIKGGVVDGKVIDAKGVEALAELPPKEVLIAKLLGSMNAPISGLVTVLGGTMRKLLYALNAVKEQKEA